MRKVVKVIILIIIVIFIMLVIDIISIKTRNKPLFAISDRSEVINTKYKGLLYDTYYCNKDSVVHIVIKFTKFSCKSKENETNVIGKIIEMNDNYISIEGLYDDNYLKKGLEGHLSLSNNPSINGKTNIEVGDVIEFKILEVKETYPSEITSKEINVISDSNETKN